MLTPIPQPPARVVAWIEGLGVMPPLQFAGRHQAGPEEFRNGITDLDVITNSDGSMSLYSLSGRLGGVAMWEIGNDGDLTLGDIEGHPGAGPAAGVTPELIFLGNGDGRAATLDSGQDGLDIWSRRADGKLDRDEAAGLSGPDLSALAEARAGGVDYLIASTEHGDDLRVYRPDGDGYAHVRSVDAGAGPVSTIFATQIGGQPGLITLSASADTIAAWQIGAGGTLQRTAEISARDGLGIDAPSAVTTVEMDGTTYAVVASAGSSTISVLELQPDGDMVPRDHMIDSRDTRFENVTAIDSIVHDGRVYVVAGGGDDGITLFTIDANGRLHVLDTEIDSAAAGLANVQAIALTVTGPAHAPSLQIYAASGSETGITRLEVDLGDQGILATADAATDLTLGTNGDDILDGSAADDRLAGGLGDDIISDGAGEDRLTGGAGADIFVLDSDGQRDVITDFDSSEDRLDLSAMGRIRSVADLDITALSNGARIRHGDEEIRLVSDDGGTITAAEIGQSLSGLERAPIGNADSSGGGAVSGGGTYNPNDGPGINVTPEVEEEEEEGTDPDPDPDTGGDNSGDGGGTGTGDTPDTSKDNDQVQEVSGGPGISLTGTDGRDMMRGGRGDDRFDGGGGADTFLGAGGIDTVSYRSSDDRLMLDLQNDRFTTGDAIGDRFEDIEVFQGSQWADQLRGDASYNTLLGGGRSDRLYGRGGDDKLDGQSGADVLYGNSGRDWMTGGDTELRDRFVYFSMTDSLPGRANRDVITDFVSGTDRIEISRIDADETENRNQEFDFIAQRAFTGKAGELRYEQEGNRTVIQADTDGDRRADFEIELRGAMTLRETDFIL